MHRLSVPTKKQVRQGKVIALISGFMLLIVGVAGIGLWGSNTSPLVLAVALTGSALVIGSLAISLLAEFWADYQRVQKKRITTRLTMLEKEVRELREMIRKG